MNHALTQIWIHAIWSTQDQMPLIKKAFRNQTYTYLRHKFQEMGCSVRIINGSVEHIHALFQLSPNMSLNRLMDHIKGESSRWINQQHFLQMPFSWQAGYCALSVSGSMVQRVEGFIRDQAVHHQKMTFNQEYRQFLTKCGFVENQGSAMQTKQVQTPNVLTARALEWG